MRNPMRRFTVVLALSIPVVLGVGTAAAEPHSTILQVPVVTGPEFGPAGVPGGLIQTVPIAATTDNQNPGTVRFAAASPKEYYYQYTYRWLSVRWRNLSTGATGSVDLRHWNDLESPTGQYGATLPLGAVVETGPGPVAVTVLHFRDQYEAPALSTALVPGLGVVFVP